MTPHENRRIGFRAVLGCLVLLTGALGLLSACNTAGKVDAQAAAVPPAPPPGYAVARFFPLAVGNAWRYVGSHLGEARDHEVRIVGRDGPWFVDSEGERFVVDQEGLRGSSRYLLRAPIQPGEDWSSVVSLSVTEHYEIIETGATATVPAGTFYGCVRVIGRVRINPTITLFKADTYCPGVGLVRIRTWLDAAGSGQVPQGEMQLAEYRIVENE